MHSSWSNIGVSRGTTIADGSETDIWIRLTAIFTAFLSGAGFFLAIFTLTPFQGGASSEAVTEASQGNIVNQIGYIALAGVYVFAMITCVDRRLLKHALPPSWLVVFAVAFWSCLQAYDPMAALRGVMLTFLSMTLVAGILLLPRSERDFVNAGANAVLLLVLIDYAAVFLMPDIATHTNDGGEPWHAGSWRGHLIHKNFAAPVFSVLAMFGIYCWRVGVKWRGAAIFLLAAVFVMQTQSKTTNGFLPLAIAIVFLSRATGMPLLTVLVHFLLANVIACLTIGASLSPTLHAITASLTSDPTFTGRESIWVYGFEALSKRFWEGYGYYSFWLSPGVTEAEINYEEAWDVRGIVSGHNSYLDALLMFGVPAGLIILSLLTLKPLLDYLKAYRHVANRPLADFFLMIVVFMTYAGMLESFLLNRADAMWLAFALGSYGMTIVAQRDVR